MEGQIAAARQSAGIATEKMTEAHKQLLALQQRISDLDGKKLTADEKSVLARKDELIQALTLLDVKQQELQKQTALNDLKKKTIQLTSQLAEEERAQRQQHDLDIATVGMGDQQRQRYQVQLSLRQKYQQQLEQLRRDSEQKGTYNTDGAHLPLRGFATIWPPHRPSCENWCRSHPGAGHAATVVSPETERRLVSGAHCRA